MRDPDGKRPLQLDPLLLTIAAAYMLVQVFLAGGVLSVLRQAQGRWTVRGLLHGAGFYFGRFLRVWVLMMLAAGSRGPTRPTASCRVHAGGLTYTILSSPGA